MPLIAFATHCNHPGIEEDDLPLVEELESKDISCIGVPWNLARDWSRFDGVLLRSTWDYHRAPRSFESWLVNLGSIGISVWNPVSTLRWNMHKSYLLDLKKSGVAIIPTIIISAGSEILVTDLLAERGWNQAVLKPANSLGGDDTILVSRYDNGSGQEFAKKVLENRDLLIQRFQHQITSEGEWSFIFIDGKFSHAVLKRPRKGEFRAQDHLGAHFEYLQPPDNLITAASEALNRCGKAWYYARVDGVVDDGKFLLMELELIEPTLFFVDFPDAARRLARRIEVDLRGKIRSRRNM